VTAPRRTLDSALSVSAMTVPATTASTGRTAIMPYVRGSRSAASHPRPRPRRAVPDPRRDRRTAETRHPVVLLTWGAPARPHLLEIVLHYAL